MNLTSPKNWKTVKLGDIAYINMGQSPTSDTYNQDGEGLPFYQGVTEFGDKYLSLKSYTTNPIKIAEAGDIIFSVRAPVGRINITKNKCCIGRGNASFRSKEGDQDFLYFLLTSLEKKIQSQSSGTVFDSINKEQLNGFEIQIPESVEDQKEIAAILSSLDDKIELLRRENKTLEGVAQTLFREWFVEFRFPAYERVKVEDGVPEGWKVGKLGDVLKLPSGFAFKSGTFSKDGKYRLVTITNVKNGYFESKTAEGINELPKNMPDYCRLDTGDILLSLTGEVGRVCIVIGENYVLNQRVSKIEPLQSRDKAFVYFLMRSKEISDQMQSIAVGAVQQNLSPLKALDIETIVPSEKHLQLFSEVVNPLFEKLISNIQEIQTVSKLRDDLLNKIFNV